MIQAASTVNKSYLLQTMADEFSKNGFTCYDL